MIDGPLESVHFGHYFVLALIVIGVLILGVATKSWAYARRRNAVPLSTEQVESRKSRDRMKTGALWGDLGFSQYSPARKGKPSSEA